MITASNVISLILLGSMVGCPLLGWISDTMGRRKPIMVIGALGALLAFTPLLLKCALSVMELCVLFFALGFFTSAQVIGYPLIAESNSVRHTGVATGVAAIIIMSVGGLGQILFGLLMGVHAGEATVADYQFALWLFPIAFLMAWMTMVFARETYCERVD